MGRDRRASRFVAASAGGAVLVLACAPVIAQVTRLSMEASVDDGQTWSSRVDVTSPGTLVYFRLRAQLLGATALGLSGFFVQPALANFRSGLDPVRPFTFPGLDNTGAPGSETEYMGRHVSVVPATNTGMIFPFGAPPMAGGPDVWTAHFDPGNVLRFGNSKATTPMTNLAWGVSPSQFPANLGGTNYDASLDVVVFRYAVRLVDVPTSSHVAMPTYEGTLLAGAARWHLNSAGTELLNSTAVELIPAIVAPSPGFGSIAIVAGVIAMRRRQRGCWVGG
jgi:hypothetical protein